MSGSGASNLGYGGQSPYVGGTFTNATSSNDPAIFSSNQVPGLPGLRGASSNVDAAAGRVPGICMTGGRKLHRKIKNISRKYKRMGSKGRLSLNKLKARLRSRMSSLALARRFLGGGYYTSNKRRRHHTRSRRTRRRMQRGGYSQYASNVPYTPSYSVAGTTLSPSNLGLANPPPIFRNFGNCQDNYVHK